MSLKPRTPSDSYTEMNELVLPNDTNILNNLMGGRLLHWMDICAAMVARKHCNRSVVTASVDSVSFHAPIQLGDIVTIKAKVARSFRSSMEIHLEVYCNSIDKQSLYKSNEAYYTFVAVDGYGSPINVPELIPETEEETKRFEGALRRRQLRLVLAGKMKPSEATELKSIFES